MKQLFLLSLFKLSIYSLTPFEQAILESNLEKFKQEIDYRLENNKKLTFLEQKKFLELSENIIIKTKPTIQKPDGFYLKSILSAYYGLTVDTYFLAKSIPHAIIDYNDFKKKSLPIFLVTLISHTVNCYILYKLYEKKKLNDQQKENYENAIKIKQLIYDIS